MSKFVIIQVEGSAAIVFEGLMFNTYEEARKFLQTKAIQIIEEQTGVSYVRVDTYTECDLLLDQRFPTGYTDSSIAFTISEVHEYTGE